MSEEVVPQQEEVVSKDAYSKVSNDMHKYKSEAKNLAQKIAELQAEQEAREKAALEEKEQWHTLYKKAEEKLKSIENERQTEKQKFVESHKINAVIQNLGGFKKPEYNRFIDSSKIVVTEDGSVDETTVLSEVERIKKEYPELIKAKQVSTLPADAPRPFTAVPVEKMSSEERMNALRGLLQKN